MVFKLAIIQYLIVLYLHYSGVPTNMASSLTSLITGALRGAPKLKKLIVGRNAFGAAAKEALKAACEERGVAAMAGYFDAL